MPLPLFYGLIGERDCPALPDTISQLSTLHSPYSPRMASQGTKNVGMPSMAGAMAYMG